MKKNLNTFILNNRNLGFDELALISGYSTATIKNTWNKLGLGWHLTPNTLLSFERISHNKYMLLNDLTVFIAPSLPIIACKGSMTDFASVPRFFHFFIDKDDNSIAIPAIAHDALYASEFVDRKVADTILLALMKYAKAPFITRNLVYMAVRIGGGFVWKGHKKEEVTRSRKLLLEAIERYDETSHFRYNAKHI